MFWKALQTVLSWFRRIFIAQWNTIDGQWYLLASLAREISNQVVVTFNLTDFLLLYTPEMKTGDVLFGANPRNNKGTGE